MTFSAVLPEELRARPALVGGAEHGELGLHVLDRVLEALGDAAVLVHAHVGLDAALRELLLERRDGLRLGSDGSCAPPPTFLSRVCG